MGVKVMNPSSSQIEELRQKFNTKYAESPPAVPFHIVDIDRIRNDHVWLQRFLEQHDLDMEASFTKLWETCIWRRSYGANDLHHTQLNQEYLHEGSIFVHSKDEDGKPLLILRVKLHSKSKNLDELIRIVVYYVERIQRERHMSQLSIFFDMAGTGLATLDLEFVKRIVETFKLYYPNALNYILVFELAWVLNAAFKVIKALLPPKAVEILKMISKKDVTQYVPKDNCLASWGGTDNYEYRFVPEAKRTPATTAEAAEVAEAANAGEDDKKVHFANSAPMVLHDTNIGDHMDTPSDGEGMLRVDPESDFVDFCPTSGEAKLRLKNIHNKQIVFKIQTTSPEKFRVRPRCGVIPPSEVAEVSIWLKQDQKLNGDKDKFLVMATMSPMTSDCNNSEVAELWKEKTSNDPDVENHRLVCRLLKSGSKGDCHGSNKLSLQEKQEILEEQLQGQRNLQKITLFLVCFLLAGFTYLLYQQWENTPPCARARAYQCPRRK